MPNMSRSASNVVHPRKRFTQSSIPEPEIVSFPERKVIGVTATFVSILSPARNNHIVLPSLWMRYLSRSAEIKGRKGEFDLGLCEPIRDAASKRHPEEFLYTACTEVSDFTDLPSGMEKKVVPGGRFAVFTHKGMLDKLPQTMVAIYGHWLPHSGEKRRDAADVELYDSRYVHGSEESEFEIHIPLE